MFAPIEVDLELAKDLGNDRAEFLGQLVLAKRRRGFGIDPFQQSRENLLLDAMNRGFETLDLAAARFTAGILTLVEAIHCAPGRTGGNDGFNRRRRLVSIIVYWRKLFAAAGTALHGASNAKARALRRAAA